MKIRSIKRPSALALLVLASAAIALAGMGAVKVARMPIAPVSTVKAATTADNAEARVVKSPVLAQETNALASVSSDEVERMVSNSKAVVVGTVLSNNCRLSPDKKSVVTEYQVQMQEIMKGDLKAGDNATVSMPGGLVLFQRDGSEVTKDNRLRDVKKEEVVIVSVSPPGGAFVPLRGVSGTKVETPYQRQPMMNGQSYLLFLVDKPDSKGFAITPGLNGTASGLQGAVNYKDVAAQPSFLDNIRMAVSREETK